MSEADTPAMRGQDLYERLHTLSKSLEGSGRIDEHDNPDAYRTVLDAMIFVAQAAPDLLDPAAHAPICCVTVADTTPAAWDDSRCDELDQLETLLREVGTINRGSDFLGRIARCIELAEALQRFDLDVDRRNFLRFLNGLAIADRNAALDRAEAAGVPTTVALPG